MLTVPAADFDPTYRGTSPMTQPLHVVCPRCDAVNRVPSERLGDEAKCGKCRGPLFAGAPLALDEGRFPRHLGRSDLPLVVDF
jgi:thioredoxin 2